MRLKEIGIDSILHRSSKSKQEKMDQKFSQQLRQINQ